MRRVIAFPCEGDILLATLDEAPGDTGLLIVSGGNEVRAGAHRGMALLAQRLAAQGIPVFRYDRRGVGDSFGPNGGWSSAEPDLRAAVTAFRKAAPRLRTVVGFGNCDGATTLLTYGAAAGVERLILANPWLAEEPDDLPPAAAIRARYAAGLRDPGTWRRFLTGGIDLRRLLGGLRKAAHAPPRPAPAIPPGTTVILADGDATAQAFRAAVNNRAMRSTLVNIRTGSHSFARPGDAAQLEAAILAALTS